MRVALFDRYGPPEELYVGETDRPSMKPEQVLVRVRAVSVNGGEVLARAGKVRFATALLSRGFPKRIGIDFTGEIADIGSSVTGLRIGDRVWGGMARGFGSAAEYVAVPPKRLGLVPDGLDLVQSAALPVATTAITALRDHARLAPGERLLVRGASGGVGNVAVQLGHAWGAHVTALASKRHLDLVRELGADEAIDYADAEPQSLGGFDVVADTVGTRLAEFRRLLRPGGRMVTIAFDLDHKLASLGYIAGSAVHGSGRVRFFSGNPGTALYDDLAKLVADGAVRPVVDSVYPLADIAAAHRALESGGVRGKILVDVAGTP
ncbi:MAG: NAD(P)-dependent alcohol dehydrogenase [Stackebrandtia sp.]